MDNISISAWISH